MTDDDGQKDSTEWKPRYTDATSAAARTGCLHGLLMWVVRVSTVDALGRHRKCSFSLLAAGCWLLAAFGGGGGQMPQHFADLMHLPQHFTDWGIPQLFSCLNNWESILLGRTNSKALDSDSEVGLFLALERSATRMKISCRALQVSRPAGRGLST